MVGSHVATLWFSQHSVQPWNICFTVSSCVERSFYMSCIFVSRGRTPYNFCLTTQLHPLWIATLVWLYTQEADLTFYFQVFSHSQFLRKCEWLVKPSGAKSKVHHQSSKPTELLKINHTERSQGGHITAVIS